jgi:hypothetical protein
MLDTSIDSRAADAQHFAAASLWIGLITIGSVLGSLAFACAAPLAAMATIAGLKMRMGEGLALVGAAWLANQLVGFLVLDYPQTGDSFAWGAAIGVAGLAAFAAAAATTRMRLQEIAAVVAAFAAAFAAYEATLFAATAVLTSSDAAFSGEVVLRLLQVNAVALVALVAAYWIAVTLRLLRPQPSSTPHIA